MTQVQFSKRLGVTQGVVSRWEHGPLAPNEEHLHRIAELAGQTVAEFRYGAAGSGDDTAITSKDKLPAGAWGHRITDHLAAAFKRAKEAGRQDIAWAIAIILEKLEREAREYPENRRADERMAFPLPDKPSIAVLPFANMSGDPAQEYFADGLTADITTALSRFEHLFVVARNSAFAYKGKQVNAQQVGRELGVRFILEGGFQRSGNRLSITTQLVDATTGGHLWAERYERGLSDIFAAQDEVMRRIVGTITTMEGTLTKAVLEHAAHKPTRNVQVYDLHLRAVHEWLKFTREGNTETRQLNRRVLELDPQFARGYSALAWCDIQEVIMGWSDNPAQSLANARDLANKSVILDDRDHHTRWALGAAFLYSRQYDEAFTEFEKAIALNPNDADIIAYFARALTFSGRAEEAIETMARAMRLNPHYPWWYSFFMGVAQFTARNYQDAVAAFQDKPGPLPPDNYLAAAHAHLGQTEAARAAAARLLKDWPDYTVGLAAEITPYQHQSDLVDFLDGLRKAGLPE